MAKFDGRMTFHLSVLPSYKNKVIGICGTYNDDPSGKLFLSQRRCNWTQYRFKKKKLYE